MHELHRVDNVSLYVCTQSRAVSSLPGWTTAMRCWVAHRQRSNFWQTTAHLGQPGQSYLPEPAWHRCQAATSLATLASGEAAGHLKSGSTDSQGADHSHSNVSQRAGSDPCTTSGSALFRCSDAGRSSHIRRTGPSRFFCCFYIHLELSTYWHSNCAKTFSLSKATWKHIYSNSLSPPVLHPAPLYLQS